MLALHARLSIHIYHHIRRFQCPTNFYSECPKHFNHNFSYSYLEGNVISFLNSHFLDYHYFLYLFWLNNLYNDTFSQLQSLQIQKNLDAIYLWQLTLPNLPLYIYTLKVTDTPPQAFVRLYNKVIYLFLCALLLFLHHSQKHVFIVFIIINYIHTIGNSNIMIINKNYNCLL